MGLTNFPGGISSFGVPVMGGGGLPAVGGDVFFVDYGNGDDGVGKKSNSARRPFKTIAKAYDLATTNKDDLIVLMGSSSHTITAMLDVSKNRVHFVGMDGTVRRYGQNARISMGVTTAATDIAAVKVTGVRCSFDNIKFSSSNTQAESLYGVADGGEYTMFSNCEFYKSSDMSEDLAAELLCNGDSSQYVRCTFGSTANVVVGAINRPCVLLARETITGKVARDVTFDDCLFWRKAADTANCFVYAPGATDVERLLWIRNSLFFNTKLATADPAECVKLTAQTEGFVVLENCTGVNVTKLSTSTGIAIQGAVPTFATSGIAKES